MARLFVSAADDAFDEREYRRLCRTYQRLGKTPPEVPAMWTSSGYYELRGLFLAGEPDLVPELFAVPTLVDEPATPDDVLVRLHEIMMKGPNDGNHEELLQDISDRMAAIEATAGESEGRRVRGLICARSWLIISGT